MRAPGGEHESEPKGCTNGPYDDGGEGVDRDGEYGEGGGGEGVDCDVWWRGVKLEVVVQVSCTIMEGKGNHCSSRSVHWEKLVGHRLRWMVERGKIGGGGPGFMHDNGGEGKSL